MKQRIDRRHFLRHATALAATGTATSWMANLSALGSASAQSTGGSDYRALVCIFLAGGNDCHNTVVPTDTTSWRCYSATRDPAVMAQVTGATVPDNMISIALNKSSLLTIGHRNAQGLNTGRTFGLHPQLKKIQQLYTQGSAAILANVGPLVQPTSKADLLDLSYPVPRKLYSHNDQTSTWQSFGPEGVTGGWGGRLMDRLAALNAKQTFASIGINSQQVWLNGESVVPYLLGTGDISVMGGRTGTLFGSSLLYQAARAAATSSPTKDVLARDYLNVANRTTASQAALLAAVPGRNISPWGTATLSGDAADPLLQFVDPLDGKTKPNPLAAQLQMVARMISAHANGAIGTRRQVFMVTLGGFDQHNDLVRQHGSLMARLDQAVDYFQRCLAQMPGGDMRSQVTTFTASEFGRGLVNNGDGADHGWGGHHFIIGGAVKGGDIYGRYPEFMAFDGQGEFFSQDLLTGGALLPSISVDQYVYTLGKWMGASETDLVGATPGAGLAPNIGNFPAETRDLGFMTL